MLLKHPHVSDVTKDYKALQSTHAVLRHEMGTSAPHQPVCHQDMSMDSRGQHQVQGQMQGMGRLEIMMLLRVHHARWASLLSYPHTPL